MLTTSMRELVDALETGQRVGTSVVTETGGSLSVDQGLMLQLAVLDRLEVSGERLSGWKVGMTSGAARDRMGRGFRPFGYMVESHTLVSPGATQLGAAGPTGIEPELAFRIKRRIEGDPSREEVADRVSGAHPAFELNASRLAPGVAQPPLEIADNLTHWGLVLGEESQWHGDVDTVEVVTHCDQDLVDWVGPGFQIDDPLESIARLSAQLNRFGRALEVGQFVITGAFHKVPVRSGTWTSVFRGIGDVRVSLEEATR